MNQLKLPLEFPQLGLLQRLLKKGDFYFHIITSSLLILIFLTVYKFDSIALQIVFISLAIVTMPFYTFFVHRYYVFSIYLENDEIKFQYMRWFRKKRISVPVSNMHVELKNKYKIGFETMIIKGAGKVIIQSVQGDWTHEILNDVYKDLSELSSVKAL